MIALILLAAILSNEGPPLAQAENQDDLVRLLLTQPSREQWTATCRGRVMPDRLLVVGGVSARSLKPSEARARLEAQLSAIHSFVEQHGGILKLLERTRAVQKNRSQRHGEAFDDQPPFVVVQWLEVRLDADAPVDDILDGLLRMGLDRFGRVDSWNPNDTRPEYLVRYGFSNLQDELDRLHDACRLEAWQEWCERLGDNPACSAAYAAVSPHLQTRSLSLSSPPIARAMGGSTQVQLGFPWSPAQIDDLELIGVVPLELRLLRTIYVGAWQNTDADRALDLANDSEASYLSHLLARSALTVMGEDRGFPEWPLERLVERTLDLLGPEIHALSSSELPGFSGDHAVYTLVHAMVTSGQTEQAERVLAARIGTSSRYDRAVALQALRNIGTPEATAALRGFRESGDDSNLAENLLADQRFPFLFDLRDRLQLIPQEQRTRRELLEVASTGCGERPTLAVYFLGFLPADPDDAGQVAELTELRRLAALPCFMTRYFAVRALALRSAETPSFWIDLFRAERDAWQRAQLARVGFSRLGSGFLDTALELLTDEPSQYVQWELMHGNVEHREGARFRTYWDLWDHPTLQMHLNFSRGGGDMPADDVRALLAWLESGQRPRNQVVHNHLLYGLARHLRGATTRRFLKLFASREDLTGSFWILQPLQDAGALPLLLYWQTLDTAEQSQRDALERVIVGLEERGLRMTVDAACCRPTRECLLAWVERSSGPVSTPIRSSEEARAWLEELLGVTVEPTIAFLDDLSRIAEVSWPERAAERWEHLYGCWRRVDEGLTEIR